MKSPRKVYGVKREGVEYIERPSVYGICEGKNQTVGVVEVKNRFFLPGGGKLSRNVDGSDETDEICLEREFLEELGWKIEVGKFLGDNLSYMELSDSGKYYEIVSRYYHIPQFTKVSEPAEMDHKLAWINPFKNQHQLKFRSPAQFDMVQKYFEESQSPH